MLDLIHKRFGEFYEYNPVIDNSDSQAFQHSNQQLQCPSWPSLGSSYSHVTDEVHKFDPTYFNSYSLPIFNTISDIPLAETSQQINCYSSRPQISLKPTIEQRDFSISPYNSHRSPITPLSCDESLHLSVESPGDNTWLVEKMVASDMGYKEVTPLLTPELEYSSFHDCPTVDPADGFLNTTSGLSSFDPSCMSQSPYDFWLPSFTQSAQSEIIPDETINYPMLHLQMKPDVPKLKIPEKTQADSGTYSCTYHGCILRFESPEELQRHKKERHRNPSGAAIAAAAAAAGNASGTVSGGMTSALQRNSQAGPHKCTRINPSTKKPCNVIFSRPYDLTRHEHSVHNTKKQRVVCQFCEEKSFSRNDALTRHMRLTHSGMSWKGSRRQRRTPSKRGK